MKTITRNNYEEFFLDYIEGKLNAREESALQAFLAENPDLKKELDEISAMDLECEAFETSEKQPQLKDIPFQLNFDDFCIAQIEGDLDGYENDAFKLFVATHPEKKKDLDTYYKTKLEADKSIVFTNKNLLKRSKKGILIKPFLFTSLATAASIAILFSIWTTEIETGTDNLNNELVSQNTPSQIVKTDSVKSANPKTPTGKEIIKEIKKTNKTVKPTPGKTKNKVPNKRINKIDVLPVRGYASFKKVIEKVEIQSLLADNKSIALKNTANSDLKLVPTLPNTPNRMKNNGLAMLGISWKASKAEKNIKEKPTLLKIAGYGVSQLGKLAGKKINLEKNYDPKTDKTRVAFNTYGIGFSAPVK